MVSVVVEGQDWNFSQKSFYPLLLIASVLWIVLRWQQNSRLYKLGNILPGPPPLPFFGNVLLALGKKPEDIVKISLEYAEKYGTVVRAWLGSKLVVFLLDADDIEVILNSQIHIDKSSGYNFFKPWLGDGLIISSGSKWLSHRKLIASTFHMNILKSFVDVFNQNSIEIVEKMRSEIDKTFNVHDYMCSATVNILLQTAMGISKKTVEESGFDYAMAVMKMCDIIHQRHFKFWLRMDAIFKVTSFFEKQNIYLKVIHGLTNKVIKSKKQTYLENKAKDFIPPALKVFRRTHYDNYDMANNKTLSGDTAVFKGYRDDLDVNDENDDGVKKHFAFLELLIQSGTHQLTNHEIKEKVNTIMFEGHDTTAVGSSFVLCLLGIYKDIQDKVYNELYKIFRDSDRPATFVDTLEMKYLERVILESLRLYPPVPAIATKLNCDCKIATNKYVLPAGATVVIGIYKIHRNPKYYKDPDTFNPDNFLPENNSNRHHYSYIPFNAGPRSCVGRKYALLKLKILLSTILRNYQVTSDVPESEFRLLADIILKRSDGFRIRIEPRTRKPIDIV